MELLEKTKELRSINVGLNHLFLMTFFFKLSLEDFSNFCRQCLPMPSLTTFLSTDFYRRRCFFLNLVVCIDFSSVDTPLFSVSCKSYLFPFSLD